MSEHIGDFLVHPFAALLPLMEGAEFDEMMATIKEHGLLEPITLTADGRTLVDGRNRLRACLKLGVEPSFTKLDPETAESDILIFIWEKNIVRRQLTPSQRAILSIELQDAAARDAKRRQREHGGTAPGRKSLVQNSDEGRGPRVVDILAKMLDVSHDTISRCKTVAENSPDLADKLRAGTMSVNEAYKEVRRRQKSELEKAKKSQPAAEDAPKIMLVDHLGNQIEYPKPKGKLGLNATNEQISWAAWSWNPVTGCLHDCTYCYAREMAFKPSYKGSYPIGFTPLFHHERLDAPANTPVPKEAAQDPRFKRVFVCSMGDLYGAWVPEEWITAVHASCIKNPQWDYLMLTKFPRRYVNLELPPTAWLGTSVDEQKRVRIAEEAFRNIKNVRVKWLSLEPLLAPLRFNDLSMFDWIVIGAQSATEQPHGHVPEFAPPLEWVTRLVDQARECGCRVYLKPNLLGIPNPQSPGMQMPQEEPQALRHGSNGKRPAERTAVPSRGIPEEP